jgi:ricin-type beta-trefoil lectin protein
MTARRKLSVALVAAVAALTVLAIRPAAVGAQVDYNVIKNVNSQMCLDDYGYSRTAGNLLVQWPCNGGDNQVWNLFMANRFGWMIQNKYSGMCVDVWQNNNSNGTGIVQWPCNTLDPAQVWSLASNQNWFYIEKYDYLSKVVEVYHSSTVAGAAVDLWSNNGSYTQKWYIDYIG